MSTNDRRPMSSRDAMQHLIDLFGISVNGYIDRIQVDVRTDYDYYPPSVTVDFRPCPPALTEPTKEPPGE